MIVLILIIFCVHITHHSCINDLCSVENIFDGEWEYGKKVHVSDPFSVCPLTLEHTKSHWEIRDHPDKWSCANSTYYHAHFKHMKCSILSLHESIRILQNENLTLIGDSLMGQMFISLKCYMEKLGFSENFINIQYLHQSLLRSDIPCDPLCLTTPSFRAQQLLVHPCYACMDGIFRPFNLSIETMPHFWTTDLNPFTSSLLVGMGAWYNVYKGLLEPRKSYNESLDVLGPLFRKFSETRNLNVYWLDLPEIILKGDQYESLFGWDLFHEYNMIARDVLGSYGVIYLDTMRAIAKRKLIDPNITDFQYHMHWCNPGPATIPKFIMTSFLHLLAREKLIAMNATY